MEPSKYITGRTAKYILNKMWDSGKNAIGIINEENLWSIQRPDEIIEILNKVLQQNELLVKKYQNGDVDVIGAIIGKIMKESNGRLSPEMLTSEPLHVLPCFIISYEYQ